MEVFAGRRGYLSAPRTGSCDAAVSSATARRCRKSPRTAGQVIGVDRDFTSPAEHDTGNRRCPQPRSSHLIMLDETKENSCLCRQTENSSAGSNYSSLRPVRAVHTTSEGKIQRP